MAALSGFQRHGGRLSAAMALLPDARRPWIDLSTGINPHAYPIGRLPPARNGRLPDPAETAELEAQAAATFGVDPGRIAAVPGSEAAIRLTPRLLAAKSVAIAGPTYSAHADAWAACGADILATSPQDLATAQADAVIAVNPNNPDGRTLGRAEIRAIAERQAQSRRWLLVDEAFADLAPEHSAAGDAGGALIVLRSFGKFYGLPGVRLGFVLAGPAIIEEVRRAFGDWPVSADAIRAGRAAYADGAWAERARLRLAKDAARLDRMLRSAGFAIVGGTGLFRLARHERATEIFDTLMQAGILTRPFEHDRCLIRFGLPRNRVAWTRLAAALGETH